MTGNGPTKQSSLVLSAQITPARLRAADAAVYCGVTRHALANMRARGGGPRYHRSGEASNSTVFYLISDLDAWVSEQVARTGRTSAAGDSTR